MSSPRLVAESGLGVGARTKARGVSALLDSTFGFFVWVAHLLAIYIGTAVACQLGLGAASEGTRAMFVTVLTVITVAAAAIVVWHAGRRYRQQRELPERRFRMSVTMGCDAIATVAIAWQLLAILLVAACT
jgi:hypothetical protein